MLRLARAALQRLFPPGRPALTIPRRPAWSTCFLSELLVEILNDLPDWGHTLSRREASHRPRPVLRFAATRFLRHGTDHDS